MTREDRPSYPWYYKDWLTSADRFSMTYEERGVYRDLLDFAWDQHGLPADKELLRVMLGLDKRKFALIWPAVSQHFTEDNGRLYNGKQERVRADLDAFKARRSDAGKRGNVKRWATRKPVAESSQCDTFATRKPVADSDTFASRKSSPAFASAFASSEEQQLPAAAAPRRFDRAHANHVHGFCAFKCLSDQKIAEFARDLPGGGDDPENYTRVLTWAENLRDSWGEKPKFEFEWWAFWQQRWKEHLADLEMERCRPKGA